MRTTPMNLTGILSSSTTDTATPPLLCRTTTI